MSSQQETKNEKPETQPDLADYRADRDDFGRLLYLLYEEIRIRKATRTAPSSTP